MRKYSKLGFVFIGLLVVLSFTGLFVNVGYCDTEHVVGGGFEDESVVGAEQTMNVVDFLSGYQTVLDSVKPTYEVTIDWSSVVHTGEGGIWLYFGNTGGEGFGVGICELANGTRYYGYVGQTTDMGGGYPLFYEEAGDFNDTTVVYNGTDVVWTSDNGANEYDETNSTYSLYQFLQSGSGSWTGTVGFTFNYVSLMIVTDTSEPWYNFNYPELSATVQDTYKHGGSSALAFTGGSWEFMGSTLYGYANVRQNFVVGVDTDDVTAFTVYCYGLGVASGVWGSNSRLDVTVVYSDSSSSRFVSDFFGSSWVQVDLFDMLESDKFISQIRFSPVIGSQYVVFIDDVVLTTGSGGGSSSDDLTPADREFINNIVNYLVPIILICLPAVFFVVFLGRDPWLIVIGLVIGVGIARIVMGTSVIPDWFVITVVMGLVAFAYKSFKG